MKFKAIKQTIVATFLVAFTSLINIAYAEVAVIVHPSNDVTLTDSDLSKLYLGKTKKYPTGNPAVPIDQPQGTASRVVFLDKLVGKSETQFKSYWSRLIFTGKGVPPKIAANDAEVIELVSRNQDAIGFIDASAVNDSVKVILTAN